MKSGDERGTDVIAGRNAVSEAIRSGRQIDSLYVVRAQTSPAVSALIAKAKAAGAVIKEVDRKKLDFMCGGTNHQGVAAVASAVEYSSVEDILSAAEAKGEPPFLIICDELNDPHNLGAILRTAECAGAHGVIIPKRRSVGLTYAVSKASAGAVEYVPVARVTNIAATIDKLKENGLWIYSADLSGSPWCEIDLKGPLAVVIGSEGFGVERLVRDKSDFIISLPMAGKINSLNASVAAGIICYEVARQRLGLKSV